MQVFRLGKLRMKLRIRPETDSKLSSESELKSKESDLRAEKLNKIKNVLMLQAVIVIYTISGIMSKAASSVNDGETVKFIVFFSLNFIFLGIYAIFWQQMIKRFELSVAYANRAMAIFWSMLWARIFFHEKISIQNILGVIIIFAGIMLINNSGTENRDMKDYGKKEK